MSGEPFWQALDGDWGLGGGVRAVAAAMPDKPAFTVLADGETIVARLCYAELDARACALGAQLAKRVAPGARVLVACNPGVDFITAFLGITYCGAVPVPVPIPRFANQARRVEAILDDAGATAIVTRELGLLALPAGIAEFAPDGADVAPDWTPTPARGEALAFLQYTSGSTGTPKGVTVTHANLAANSALLRRTLGYDACSVSLTWLPPSHDMGLIEGLLQPILHGVGAIVLPTGAFLRRPIRWLQAITRFGVTHSGGPNFAYQLCVDRVRAGDRAALDLSSWQLAYAGAEPIRYEVLDQFAHAFAQSGFRRSALYASYGLAEATLLVSNGPAEPVTLDAAALETGRVVHVRAGGPGVRTVVRCGRPDPELAVSIRDPKSGQHRPANRVGEICLSGASVSRGYWVGENEPPVAPEFCDDDGTRWLRTGDLGFFDDGRIVVTGRLKDLVIVHGRNLNPHDIEAVLKDTIASLRRMPVAFDGSAIENHEHGGLIIAFEAPKVDAAALDDTAAAIRRALVEAFEVDSAAIVAIGHGQIRHTTSGKVMRADLARRYADGSLEVVAIWRGAGSTSAAGEEDATALLAARFADLNAVRDRTLAELGGDSLFAAQIAQAIGGTSAQIHSAALLRMTIAEILARAGALRSAALAHDIPAASGTMLAATAAQRGLYYVHELWQERDPFVLSLAGRIGPNVDVSRFVNAVRALVARHPLLASRFAPREDAALVCFAPRDDAEAIVTLEEDPAAVAFESSLAEPPRLPEKALFAARVFRFEGAGAGFIFRIHHAVADAASLAIAWDDLTRLYDGEPLAFQAPRAAAIEAAEAAAHGADARAFWQAQLASAPLGFELPLDHQRLATSRFTGARAARTLDRALGGAVAAFAAERRCSPAAVFLAAFAGLAMRQSGKRDVVLGVPMAMRHNACVAGEVGLVAQTGLVRIALGAHDEASALVLAAEAALFDAQTRRPFDLEALLRDAVAPPPAGTSVPRLLFNWIADQPGSAALGGWVAGDEGARIGDERLSAELVACAPPPAYHDLTLHVVAADGGYRLVAHYAREVFEPARIARLLDEFATLLAALVDAPATPLGALPLLPQAEIALLDKVAGAAADRAPAATLHGLFIDQVHRSPDAVALDSPDERIGYRALRSRAAALAARLANLGVRPGDRVGVHLARTPDLVVAILAVLEAGAAYVPMDPRYPSARLAGMFEDARVAAVLSAEAADWLVGVPVVDPAEPFTVDPGWEPIDVPPESAAYVLFTSGTTGRPKGVVISHRSAAGLMAWAHDQFGEALARVFASTSASFDLSVFEMFAPLTSGGTVILAESLLALPEMAEAFAPTLASGVPSVFAALLERGGLPPLVALAVAGEPLGGDLADRLLAANPGVRLYDLYGPTEVTTYATAGERGSGDPPTIGTPLPWTGAYILDDQLERLPFGTTGEIWLAGDRVAQGYFDRPGCTADRFRPDPFSRRAGAVMYRTGDAGAFRADGSLVYRGRLDRQIKLRGYRIEQAEIETAIARHPDVGQAAVLVLGGKSGASDRLVACISPATANAVAVIEFVGEWLPAFMVPQAVYPFEMLPVTANGKLDRDRVEAMARDAAEGRTQHARSTGAQSPALAQVIAIIARAAGLDALGPDDNVFALGATSLDAVRIQNALRAAFSIEVPLRTLFRDPSPRAVARLSGAEANAVTRAPAPALRMLEPSRRPLIFTERQLWAASVAAPHPAAFHLPMVVDLAGGVDPAALAGAIAAITARHPVLRTRLADVSATEGVIAPPGSAIGTLHHVARDAGEAVAILAQAASQRFDLVRDPPLRVVVVTIANGRSRIGLTAHHLFIDGAALAAIAAELRALLAGTSVAALPAPVAPPAADRPESPEALAYWRATLAGARAAALAPSGGDPASDAGMTQRLVIDAALSAAVRSRVAATGTPPFTLLLASFALATARREQCRDLTFAVAVDLRPILGHDRSVGMLVQPVLVRIVLDAEEDVAAVIAKTGAALADAIAHAEVPFERVLSTIDDDRAYGDPFYRILFAGQDGVGTAAGDWDGITMLDTGGARADLTILVRTDRDAPITAAFEGRRSIYDENALASLAADWIDAIAVCVGDGKSAIALPPATRSAPVAARPVVEARSGETVLESLDGPVAAIWAEVLGSPPLADTSFFAAGGNSLAAVRLLGRLELQLGTRIALRDFYARTTFAELVEAIARHRPGTSPEPPQMPEAPERLAEGPPSLAQDQLLFFERLRPGTPLYNVGLVLRLSGSLDADRLEDAFRKVVARHPALRLRLSGAPPQARQWLENGATAIERATDATSDEPSALADLRGFLMRPFALDREPPFRARLVSSESGAHLLALSAHHAAVDAQSLALVVEEIGRLYRGETLPPPCPLGPIEYAAWECSWGDDHRTEATAAWWREHLAGASPALALPFDPVALNGAGTMFRRIGGTDAALLRRAAFESGAGSVALMLAAYARLLGDIAGRDRLVVGLPVNTRRAPHLDAVGFFSNTAPLALDLAAAGPDPLALVRAIREAIGDAQDHGWLPLPVIVQAWRPPRDAARPALFHAMFAMETGVSAEILPGRTERVQIDLGMARCDLLLIARETPDAFEIQLQHAAPRAGCSPEALADRLVAILISLADALVAPPAQNVTAPTDDPHEALLAHVEATWREVLGVEHFDPDRSFFDHGGSSLELVAVQTRLEARLSREVPLSLLFGAPRIADLVAALDPSPASPPARPARRRTRAAHTASLPSDAV